MKIVVHDASVLIDLAACEFLGPWFGLGLEMRTTSLVWREVNRKNQKARLQRYVDEGSLGIEPINAEAMTGVVNLHAEVPSKITLEDASALYIAEKRKAILLTGDKGLRQYAADHGIEVHGMLWVIDTLVARGAILPSVAAERLEWLTCQGTCRLPKQDCSQRIKKWRNQ